MKQRIILIADEGKILTDGESYATAFYLAEDRNIEEYQEVDYVEEEVKEDVLY